MIFDVKCQLSKFLNNLFNHLNFFKVSQGQYQREMAEFADKLSSDEDRTVPESPDTPSPVKSTRSSRRQNIVNQSSNNEKTDTKIKKTRGQLRLEKIKGYFFYN